ncbi:MAG: hypothetical protein QM817_38565 [Archangium sp.]
MKNARLLSSVVVLALAASGCSNIAASLPTRMPVLLSRVDRIGGTALPPANDKKDDFDGESGSGFWVFYGSAYPVVSAQYPSTMEVDGQVRAAAAERAGQGPLRDYNMRLTGYRAGSYIHFFGGTYGTYRYWRAFGSMERP